MRSRFIHRGIRLLGLLGAAFLLQSGNASAADQAQAFPFFVFDNGLNGIQDPPRVLRNWATRVSACVRWTSAV